MKNEFLPNQDATHNSASGIPAIVNFSQLQHAIQRGIFSVSNSCELSKSAKAQYQQLVIAFEEKMTHLYDKYCAIASNIETMYANPTKKDVEEIIIDLMSFVSEIHSISDDDLHIYNSGYTANSGIVNVIQLEMDLRNPERQTNLVITKPITVTHLITQKPQPFDLLKDQMLANCGLNYAKLGIGSVNDEILGKIQFAEDQFNEFTKSKGNNLSSIIGFIELLRLTTPDALAYEPLGFSPYYVPESTEFAAVLDCVNAIHYDADLANTIAKEIKANISSKSANSTDIACALLLQASGFINNPHLEKTLIHLYGKQDLAALRETNKPIVIEAIPDFGTPQIPTEGQKPEQCNEQNRTSGSHIPPAPSTTEQEQYNNPRGAAAFVPGPNQTDDDESNEDGEEQDDEEVFIPKNLSEYSNELFGKRQPEENDEDEESHGSDFVVSVEPYNPNRVSLTDTSLDDISIDTESEIAKAAKIQQEDAERRETEARIAGGLIKRKKADDNQRTTTKAKEKAEIESFKSHIDMVLVSNLFQINHNTAKTYPDILIERIATRFDLLPATSQEKALNLAKEFYEPACEKVTEKLEKARGKTKVVLQDELNMFKEFFDKHIANEENVQEKEATAPAPDKITAEATTAEASKNEENSNEASETNFDEQSTDEDFVIKSDATPVESEEGTSENKDDEKSTQDETSNDAESEQLPTPPDDDTDTKDSDQIKPEGDNMDSTDIQENKENDDFSIIIERIKQTNLSRINKWQYHIFAKLIDIYTARGKEIPNLEELTKLLDSKTPIQHGRHAVGTESYANVLKKLSEFDDASVALPSEVTNLFDVCFNLFNRRLKANQEKAAKELAQTSPQPDNCEGTKPEAVDDKFTSQEDKVNRQIPAENIDSTAENTSEASKEESLDDVKPSESNDFEQESAPVNTFSDLIDAVREKLRELYDALEDNSDDENQSKTEDSPTGENTEANKPQPQEEQEQPQPEADEVPIEEEKPQTAAQPQEEQPTTVADIFVKGINYLTEIYNDKKLQKFELGELAISINAISFETKVIETDKIKSTSDTKTEITKEELAEEPSTIDPNSSDFVKEALKVKEAISDSVKIQNVSSLGAKVVSYSMGKFEIEGLYVTHKTGKVIPIDLVKDN